MAKIFNSWKEVKKEFPYESGCEWHEFCEEFGAFTSTGKGKNKKILVFENGNISRSLYKILEEIIEEKKETLEEYGYKIPDLNNLRYLNFSPYMPNLVGQIFNFKRGNEYFFYIRISKSDENIKQTLAHELCHWIEYITFGSSKDYTPRFNAILEIMNTTQTGRISKKAKRDNRQLMWDDLIPSFDDL